MQNDNAPSKLLDATPSTGEGRERVLNEAYALFVAVGYAEVSMQQIAVASGVTKATLYHHFASKDELFGSVCRRELQRIRAGVADCIDPVATFRDQLEAVARFFLEHGLHSDVIRLMTDFERHLPPEQRLACMAGEVRPDEMLRPVFERAAANGELRGHTPDLDLAVGLFFGMIFGQIKSAHHRHAGQPPRQARDLAPAIADALLYGIGAERAVDGAR
jgi:TetR/AcrR family transcriptional repressor of mexJK operon